MHKKHFVYYSVFFMEVNILVIMLYMQRERALDESGKLLERYTWEKLHELPEESLLMKRKADMLKADIDVKRRRLDECVKKNFKK